VTPDQASLGTHVARSPLRAGGSYVTVTPGTSRRTVVRVDSVEGQQTSVEVVDGCGLTVAGRCGNLDGQMVELFECNAFIAVEHRTWQVWWITSNGG